MTPFADRLVAATREKNSVLMVGIDPRLDLFRLLCFRPRKKRAGAA